MFKVSNNDVWRRSGVLIVSFEHISHFVLMFLLFKISLYALLHIKIIPWKFDILNPKNSRVIRP